MKLQEIIEDLLGGELAQVNLGVNAEGILDKKHYGALISKVNLGLTELHKRFSLKLNHIELIFDEGRYRYHLETQHKYSDEALVLGDFRIDVGDGTLLLDQKENSDPEYIRDQPYAPFENDILLITRVVTPGDRDLPLNVVGNPWSVTTPKANVLEFPRRIVDQVNDIADWLRMDRVYVHYRQGHVKLRRNAGEYDANRVEIDLPETHRQALLYFIASGVMNPIGMGQEFNAGNTYYQKFLLECQSLTEGGMYIDQSQEQDKFNGRGFV